MQKVRSHYLFKFYLSCL